MAHLAHTRCHALASPATPGQHLKAQDRELVRCFRAIQGDGFETMTAVERYDANFSLKLTACTDRQEAETLLGLWLQRRTQVLARTRNSLLDAWTQRHGPAS